MTNTHDELVRLAKEYKALVFQNDGYEELPGTVIEDNRQGFDEITSILREHVEGFVRFQNFKRRADGSLCIRCQTRWSPSFTGVSYISLEDFKKEPTK